MAEKKIDTTIVAEVRESFGKGAARKMRVLGKIPAVVYGHGTEPQHLALPGHQVALLLRRKNAVLEIKVNGKTQLALVKDVQKDPVKAIIEHIDLIVIRKGEKVIVDISVHVEGESYPGTIANLESATISVEAEATHIPESVVVNIEGFEDGTQIHASDLELPAGSTLVTDPETLVINIVIPAEVDLGEDEDEVEAAEGDEATESTEAAE
ncbi:50S ribosomal protein L25/general stress protein Ctc [Marisediminicola antarctica]|uniref:Large ribosomal subunit protein bL25 n=1 Tax=Marisediminicola antarctica TaxID=674079 RepID=A0A7L5AIV0_9MICO|nr:50S ribosomal protein L25/general stress protein Ctc [Marisediminicola antarctica]QHO69324.1 50S ribosomal protein L25/general stress protein Ctc [Marisediminicola antarctica]